MPVVPIMILFFSAQKFFIEVCRLEASKDN